MQYSTLPNDLLNDMAPAGILPRTLKSRMTTVVIVLVLAATTIVTTVALMLAEHDMKAVIGAQQYAVLSTAASYVDQQLEAKRALLSTLPEGLPPGIHSDPAALQALLLARPAVGAEFSNVVAFDRSGKIVATLRPDLKEAGVGAAGAPYFDTTVKTRRGLISAPFMSRLSGRPVVLMTQPVLDPKGEVAYVIAAGIDLQQSDFFGPINGLKPGKTGFMFIMTTGGILLHHPTPERLLRHINDRPGVNLATEMALKGFEGWTEARNKDGSEGIYSYKRLKATNWIVAALGDVHRHQVNALHLAGGVQVRHQVRHQVQRAAHLHRVAFLVHRLAAQRGVELVFPVQVDIGAEHLADGLAEHACRVHAQQRLVVLVGEAEAQAAVQVGHQRRHAVGDHADAVLAGGDLLLSLIHI